jgi:hypothetical protein
MKTNDRRDTGPAQQVHLALQPNEIESVKAFARLHDRSVEQEVRLALRMHMKRMLLNYIMQPAGRDDLTAEGYDPDEQESALRRSLATLEAEAYSLPEGAASRLRAHDHLWLGR